MISSEKHGKNSSSSIDDKDFNMPACYYVCEATATLLVSNGIFNY